MAEKRPVVISSAGGKEELPAGDTVPIANNQVTLAKLAQMVTTSLLGRSTAGTGNVEVLSASTVRTLLSLVVGTDIQGYDSNTSKTNVAEAFTGHKTLKEVSETVYTLSGTTPAIDPANGTIQTWTLSANSTPTDGLTTGQSVTLVIDDGTSYTITWPTVTWVGGSAPTLDATGKNVVVLWKIGSTLYGASIGVAA